MTDYTTTNTPARQTDDAPYLPPVVEALDAMIKRLKPPFVGEVLADIQARAEYGLQKYGVPLRPFDTSDPIKEAYQEAIDGAIYATQALMEISITPLGEAQPEVSDSDPVFGIGIALSSVMMAQIMILSSLRSILACRDLPDHPSPITVDEMVAQGVDLSE